MKRWLALCAVLVLCCSALPLQPAVAADVPLLLRDPTVSRSQIAFCFGGDIWIVGRSGGSARRLITGYDLASGPHFSPNGEWIAFTGNYEGHNDVYVVAASGGEPRRLTYHPAGNVVVGWTPDGKSVLFRSSRASFGDPNQLFTVPVSGGFATELPLTMAEDGSYSPDGTHLAYVPGFRWEPFWQGYRGGQASKVLVADLADSSVVAIPRNGSNDETPMWVDDQIYFLSDRDGPKTLFRYDPHTHAVRKLIDNHGFDITSASAGAGAIVYAQFDSLHLYDLASGRTETIHVSVDADMAPVRPHWENVARLITNADISPTGVRAVFEAHGDILTVPAEHGDIRNITATPAVEERDPAWSPDGRWIAYFSDASGEYRLAIRDQRGMEPPRFFDLGGSPTYYYSPTWSPDSKKIAYTDKHNGLYYLDIQTKTVVKVTTQPYGDFSSQQLQPAWSPDSKWIAYALQHSNFQRTIDLYSLEERRSHQVTDGLSDASIPQFDASGKYLYFAASTNTGLTSAGLDMEADQRPTTSSVYAIVLRRDLPSPLTLQTADEPTTGGDEPGPKPSPAAAAAPASPAAKAAAAKAGAHDVHIDFDGILQRIVALPIEEGNYVAAIAGKPGELFLQQYPITSVSEDPPTATIVKFDLTSRKTMTLAQDVNGFALSADGTKMLVATHGRWAIVSSAAPVKPGDGVLPTQTLEVYVDPPAQWAQMYRETWRIEREFFYDPHYHGLDIAAAEKRFAIYLPGITSRVDLTFLFEEMLSYMSVGHMFVRGGTLPPTPRISVGLLGADYTIENGRYRFAKIYDGENWNPDVQAPLTQPGTNVKVGEYLLAVNGTEIEGSQDVYKYFQETAGKQTTITVGPNPSMTGSRQVVVVPVPSEARLRNLAWIEDNRRRVDKLSGGKLAYVYLPDTEYGGFTNFNRYYFAQVGKEGVIVDERFNHGGQIADYIVDLLARKTTSIVGGRDGKTVLDPPLIIRGPKVMIINEFAGSGGDALPWNFRKAGLGPLVGERTWGGLVGIGGYPPLMDGGLVTAPRAGIGGLHGQWEVENHGIAPDIEVFQDPKAVREGRDPQLDAAVRTALQLLREHPLPVYHLPPFPDHHPVLPPGP
jgi:tricorn protease